MKYTGHKQCKTWDFIERVVRMKQIGMVLLLCCLAVSVQAIDAHWQPPADPNRIPGTPELWSKSVNWSTGIAPNAADQTVWVATANSAPCLLDSGTWQINQLKLGEGSDQSSNGRLIVKGILNTNLSGNWQGIGAWGNQVGVLEIDGGQFNTYGGGHMWIGNQGSGTVIVRNGGQLNVGVGGGAQMGHGWDGTTGVGRTFIYDGLVTVNNWTTGSVHPNTPSFIDISRGTLSIQGYRISPGWNDGAAVDRMAEQGRITGFREAKFDKKVNIDNPGTDRQNDVINNVVLKWNGSRTLVTAIHPQQPAPYFNDILVAGDIEFAWNNWDPNMPGDAISVDLWVGTEPNKLSPNYTKVVSAMDVTGQARSSKVIKITAPGKYFWQVDTTNGPGSFHEGDQFWFEVVSYRAPELSGADSVITTMDLLPAAISGTVAIFGTPLTGVNFALLADDMNFPAGANAVLTNTTTNLQNPTATLTTDKAGIYKVKLTITDGTTTIEKLIEVNVYSDACQAKKDSPSGWTANYYDRDGDCDVDVADFAVFAREWLDDTTMKAQETRPRDVMYIPQIAFDNRIEAESVDPDAVSNAPVTDENGVRIVNEGGATGGGQALGWTGNGTWAEYQITIPAAGVYDVVYSICTPQTTTVLNFGDGTTASLYGSVGPLPSFGAWGNYGISMQKSALSFPAAGTYTVRITWTNEANLDWFTLLKQ